MCVRVCVCVCDTHRTIEDVGALTLSMGSTSGRAISLDQLTAKVAAVYVRCGFDPDQSIGTLQVC